MTKTSLDWLHARGLSDDSITAYGIDGDDSRIVIPVRDRHGAHLFNKYRTIPQKQYLYDRGATAALFGLDVLGASKWCILSEGELDAVRLHTEKIPAVSGTGGCGSFKDEWLPLLPALVFICYDSDDPGKDAAIRIHWRIPNSRIIDLPETTKDITEFFKAHTKEDFEALVIKSRIVPKPEPAMRFASSKYTGNDMLLKAKSVPITQFINFPPNNTTKCIWHDEDTPSMHYYEKTNHVHCFGCRQSGDSISVTMQLKGVSFKEAVDLLNNH